MKQYHLIAILLVSACLGLGSCREQLRISEDRVELSVSQEGDLVLPAGQIDQRIAVKTNQAQWSSLSQSEWLQARAEGREIHLTASANSEPRERRAVVQVMAGGLTHSFSVIQQAAGSQLEVELTSKSVDQWQREFLVDVNANIDTWQVKTEADWLEIIPKHRDGQILVKVSENKARQDRRAVVEISDEASGLKRSFEVVQQGIIYYILPCTDYKISEQELIRFETARSSTHLGSPSPLNPVYRFATVSPVFKEVIYFSEGPGSLSGARLMLGDRSLLQDEGLAEYVELLKQSGYEDDGGNIYYSDKAETEVEFDLQARQPQVLFSYYSRQERALPSLDHLPLEVSDFGTTTRAEVDAWQKAHGGVHDPKISQPRRRLVGYRSYEQVDGEQVSRAHVYRFSSKGLLLETTHTDPKLSRYIYLANNAAHLSRAFRLLLSREGFAYVRHNEEMLSWVYRNEAKKIELNFRFVANPYPQSPDDVGEVMVMKFKNYK